MIQLTRLNRSAIVLNAIYIERLESTPDTVVTLTTGKKVHVLETVEEVMDKVTVYYRKLNILPRLHEPNLDE
ncbi:flagellar FlbD family protein [Planococcus sp. APC 3900]|uniref:Flagellar FlbD family protein n=3 Tax=Caryophanaceae TaxID=186818 RepID=A0ABT7ZML7_9BACL|nr:MULTISPECIES: flagellar FlbD family protein [Planococcus]MBD8014915.1 flagellar FlbD family protein [Planococcus wigleyi]MBF6634529.1 flagellar FlbD family protein [Planococcus sp. (in: firmicutes)]MDN3427902.1 flagellar FlbD family protein [Planococcus sp. APC 4016]MDN3439145.1 flagellar FlbD family protein [Planococcus sp. APC 3900]